MGAGRERIRRPAGGLLHLNVEKMYTSVVIQEMLQRNTTHYTY